MAWSPAKKNTKEQPEAFGFTQKASVRRGKTGFPEEKYQFPQGLRLKRLASSWCKAWARLAKCSGSETWLTAIVDGGCFPEDAWTNLVALTTITKKKCPMPFFLG